MEDIQTAIGKQSTYEQILASESNRRLWMKSNVNAKSAAKYAGAVTHKLAWDEYLAIMMWTKPLQNPSRKYLEGIVFDSINGWLRSDMPALEMARGSLIINRQSDNPYREFGIKSSIYHMLRGMKRIGTEEYTKLYRFQGEGSVADFVVGQTFTQQGFYATTAVNAAPAGFATKPVKITITNAVAYPVGVISLAPGEKEVLFPPGSIFDILDIKKNQPGPQHTLIELKHIDPVRLE